jgi:hypothetical protein
VLLDSFRRRSPRRNNKWAEQTGSSPKKWQRSIRPVLATIRRITLELENPMPKMNSSRSSEENLSASKNRHSGEYWPGRKPQPRRSTATHEQAEAQLQRRCCSQIASDAP